jgi:plastocyanin
VKPVDKNNPINAINPLLNHASPDGLLHAHYQSMTYTGIYVDRAQLPAPLIGGCAVADYAPTLIGADTFEAQGHSVAFPSIEDDRVAAIAGRYRAGAAEGMLNHLWVGDPDAHCGVGSGQYAACEFQPNRPDPQWSTERIDTNVVHVGAFVYAPGDLSSSLPLPRVRKGTRLTFVNEDVAINVRHTITSCKVPCNGQYVANYPLPDGFFDSGKLGNLDPIDGGLTGADTVPVWTSPANLAPGLYSYYCRIHPWMRGAFEVAPSTP